jgi:hypothetical protein
VKARKRSADFQNPFVASGLLRLVRASLSFLIGLFVLFRALAAFRENDTALLLLGAFAASILILSGLIGVKQAIDRLTGFEPDPRSPADLSKRQQGGKEAASVGRSMRYSPTELSELLDVGSPPEGGGRAGLLGRLAELFLPGLRFSPPEIRLLIEYIFTCLVNTLIILGLAVFFLQASNTVGLEMTDSNKAMFWWVLATVMLARWHLFVRSSTLTMQLAQMKDASPGTLQGLIFFLAALAIGAVLVSSLDFTTLGLDTSQFESVASKANASVPQGLVFIILLLAAGLSAMTVFFWLIRQTRLRSLSGELDEGVTQVRFQRDGVGNSSQFSEAIITSLQDEYPGEAVRIYNSGPRVYAETQPQLQKAPIAKFVPFLAEGVGNVLLLISAVVLAFRFPDVDKIHDLTKLLEAGVEPSDSTILSAWQDLNSVGPWLLTFLIFGGFGKWFLGLSEVFLGETNFRSLFLRAQMTGTETRVKQAIGNASFDTFKTEIAVPFTNGVVEGSAVVLHSCAFARPNKNGLMGPRSILEFGSDNGELRKLIDTSVRSLDELKFMPQLQRQDVSAVQDAVSINTKYLQAVNHGGDVPKVLEGRTAPDPKEVGFEPGKKDDDD